MVNRPVISVVVPLYCESASLRKFLASVKTNLERVDESYELVLVDDGSTDGTWDIIEEESVKFAELRALQLSRNFGKESALSAGIEMARGDAVITMDGDMQHPPDLIPEMIRIWHESGADIVEAVKEHRGKEPFVKKIGAKIFYLALNKFSGYELKNASDFKLMSRKVINAWLDMRERNLFFRGMSMWLGFNRVQIPFTVQERSPGKSRWSLVHLIKLALTAITAFSSIPLRIVTIFGSVFSIFAALFTGYALFMKLSGKALSGFTTVILLQLVIGSLLMLSLGIIGEYIAGIYNEVKGRPRYIVARMINKTAGCETGMRNDTQNQR
jgi:glycosyltransferase involved in cell wall biosynthesis